MESKENTSITDAGEETGQKKTVKPWIIGIAIVALVAVVAFAVMRTTLKPSKHQPTAEEAEQLKYDADRKERDQRKADLIRDQNFIVREEDRAQSEQLLKDFKADPAEQANDRQVKQEEEAINHVLRGSTSPATVAAPPPPPAQVQQTTAQDNTTNLPPMFVYSRGFGGARYVDTPSKTESPQVQNTAVTSAAEQQVSDKSDNIEPEQEPEKKTQLIYSGIAPVVVNEGEMLEAVLVNRLIVDTEPSPVICNISRDLFDKSGQYVVLPANSRVIGSAQAVGYKGASRLFISFHRLILPNGLSVDLPSSRSAMKALDETGAIGIVSNVDRHWFLQFGAAAFLGVLDGIAGYAQRDQANTVNGLVISRTSENFDRVLDRVMSQYSSIVPTIRVDQGKTLRIYISDDMIISPYARISDRSYYNAYQ